MYILLCGGGVGILCGEEVCREATCCTCKILKKQRTTTITFEDSKEGWAKGFNEYLFTLYLGWDSI